MWAKSIATEVGVDVKRKKLEEGEEKKGMHIGCRQLVRKGIFHWAMDIG